MCSTLLFLRHGIRGGKLDDLSSQTDCIIHLASEENLSRDGHNLSFKVGQMIRSICGKIDFIYADITTSRTVDTAISFAKGSRNKIVHFSKTTPDTFF